MLKKFLSKYFMDVIPSIVATVVGAYIVTHYVNATRPDADKPKAAVTAPAETAKDAPPQPVKADDSIERAAAAAKAAEAKAAEVKAARLKSEKLAADKAAAEKAAADKIAAEKAAAAEKANAAERAEVARKAAADKLAAEKLAAEKAAVEKREREKSIAKSAPSAKLPAEASAAPEDGRDANDLARAAIERLRSAEPRASQPQRTPEAGRAQELIRSEQVKPEQTRSQPSEQERPRGNDVVYAPVQSAPQPLPPAVTVAPAPNAFVSAPVAASASPAPPPAATRTDDFSRPTPPADIPSRPLDLHPRSDRNSVAEDVVSAAKSVFQAVVPDPTN
jgi:hypothetical protein